MAARTDRELFELSVFGGAAEARYRRARPDIDALPWQSLDLSQASPAQLLAARREWTDAALHEYASAAYFSLTMFALVRARVPIDLSAMLSRFPLDEIAHAELCARVAGALGGGTPIEYTSQKLFPQPPPPPAGKSNLMIAAERVVHDMCVRETWSLAVIRALHRHNKCPLYKALWGQIAQDESAHAGFGWLFLEWAELTDAERKQLGTLARQSVTRLRSEIDRAEAKPPNFFSPFGIVASIGRANYIAAARRVIDKRIVPVLERYGIDAA